MYTIRNKEGWRVGLVDVVLAGRLMNTVGGQWVEKNFIETGKQNIFVFKQSCNFGNDEMKIVIMEGYYLEQGV